MYLVLFAFGAVLAAAGLAFGAAGISIHDRAFDASLLTPGVLALVGGLILIGLGLALRSLQRIESALVLRPMPRAIRPGDAAASVPGFEAPAEPRGIRLAATPDIRPHAAADAAPPLPAEPKLIDPARLKSSTLAGIETAAAGIDTAPPAPHNEVPAKAQPRLAEPPAERPVTHRNGGGPPKTAPRLDVTAHPLPATERAKAPGFDTFWPKGPRPQRVTEPTPAPARSTARTEQSSAPAVEPSTAAVEGGGPEPVSVLKSGVVDGMAYTLFSDGSIEAQLPQGTLRFGSITELRYHIEQAPPDVAAS